MTESESVALPLGDAALTNRIIADGAEIVKGVFQKPFDAGRKSSLFAGAFHARENKSEDNPF